MDLFPEGFAAEGKVSLRNPMYRWIIRQTYKHAPRRLIALGPRQATHVLAQYGRAIPTTVLPCGVLMHQQRDPAVPDWRTEPGMIYIGYAGNVGQAHSVAFLRSIIRHLDPSRFRLVLALYGPKADEVWEAVTDQKGIIRLAHISRSQLSYLDLQLVSLLPQWTHIAVPSKAVSAIGAGSPILFCGHPDSDSYVLLREAAFLIDAHRPIDEQVAHFLQTITAEQLRAGREAAERLALGLQQLVRNAYADMAQAITNWPAESPS